MKTFASLSGPDFVRMDRRQIKALSLDELQLLTLRSQALLATALFKPAQCLFEVMPDEYVLHVLLEWLTIEDQARLDRALKNHKYRKDYLYLLRDTEHKGVLSVSENEDGYMFNCGVAEWLESRNVFMRALKFCDLARDIPAGFLARTGRQLLEIELDECHSVTDAGLTELVGYCPRLEVVKFSDCREVTDAAATTLAQHCPGLHTVDLSGTQVTAEGIAKLGESCKSLKTLGLRKLEISDDGLAMIAERCLNLENVSLLKCGEITDISASSLARCFPRLHSVDLSGTAVTDEGLASLADGCRALKKIALSGLAITDRGLCKLAESCLNLEDLDLHGCYDITDAVASSLAKHCFQIHTLRLGFTDISDAGVAILGESCRAIKNLELTGLEFTDAGLHRLAELFPRIEDLDLSYCREVTDAALASLAQLCPRIHTLNFSFTKITDAGLARLGDCRALTNIRLSGLAITDSGLGKLGEECPMLVDVCVASCANITYEGAVALAQHCPRLYLLGIRDTQVTHECVLRLRNTFPATIVYGVKTAIIA
jgi:F-box/leucine-rich repeat protein 2/20